LAIRRSAVAISARRQRTWRWKHVELWSRDTIPYRSSPHGIGVEHRGMDVADATGAWMVAWPMAGYLTFDLGAGGCSWICERGYFWEDHGIAAGDLDGRHLGDGSQFGRDGLMDLWTGWARVRGRQIASGSRKWQLGMR